MLWGFHVLHMLLFLWNSCLHLKLVHALLCKKHLNCCAEWRCILQFYHKYLSDAGSLYNYLLSRLSEYCFAFFLTHSVWLFLVTLTCFMISPMTNRFKMFAYFSLPFSFSLGWNITSLSMFSLAWLLALINSSVVMVFKCLWYLHLTCLQILSSICSFAFSSS